MIATWQGSSQRRPMTGLNQPAGPEGVSLFTSAWGAATPPANDTIEVVLNSFPPVAPADRPDRDRRAQSPRAASAIPPGGAVLVGRGALRRTARNRGSGRPADHGPPRPPAAVERRRRRRRRRAAVIVQNTPAGLPGARGVQQQPARFAVRAPRSASARDRRSSSSRSTGALPGYSTGMTNFELAQQHRCGSAP